MTRRPLAHIRILDFGHYLAGPLAGMMLADMGADVIRIDPPGGPVFADPATDMLSRGKSSLVLDLKSAAGRDTAIELVRRGYTMICKRAVRRSAASTAGSAPTSSFPERHLTTR